MPPPTNKTLPMKSLRSKMALLLQYLCDHENVICCGSGALRGELLSIFTSISCPYPFPQSVSYPPSSPSLPSICFLTFTSVQSSTCALYPRCVISPNCILSDTCLNHPICVMSPNRLLSPACIHMHCISPVSFPLICVLCPRCVLSEEGSCPRTIYCPPPAPWSSLLSSHLSHPAPLICLPSVT